MSLSAYRVHVDGARVGTLGEGETLLVGLTAGPHTVQGWINGFSSRPLDFHARVGVPLHLILEPGGTATEALTDLRGRKGDYLRLTPHRLGLREANR